MPFASIRRTFDKFNVPKAIIGLGRAKRDARISRLNLENRQFNARQKSIGSSKRKPLIDPKTFKKVK